MFGQHRSPGRLPLAVLLGLSLSQPAYPQVNPTPAPASDPRSNRMLILDASGSMWNNVSDAASPRRAELAAKFVDSFTTKLADETPQRTLGMVRLGYQYPWFPRGAYTKETLCSDVEVVVKPAMAAQVRAQIARESGAGRNVAGDDYNPKGYTPLKLAIEKAVEAAPPEGATLVVVTDLDAKDVNCLPDPCGDDGKPLPELKALMDRRHIRIRYVIAAGLIGAIGDRARRFAACFGAEYRLLDDINSAGTIGDDVGVNLIRETPRAAITRGTISVALQNARGDRVSVPPGSQLDVRRARSNSSLLHAPGQQETEAGRYEASLSVSGRKWPMIEAEVSADRQTDIAYVVADGILRISLVDSDFRPIDNAFDTVWEIGPASGTTTQTLRLKGTRLIQTLPPGGYSVHIYTGSSTFQMDVSVEAGRESSIEVHVENY